MIGQRKLICEYGYRGDIAAEELAKSTVRVLHVPEDIAEQVIEGFRARGWRVTDERV